MPSSFEQSKEQAWLQATFWNPCAFDLLYSFSHFASDDFLLLDCCSFSPQALHPFAAYTPLIYLRIDFGSAHLGPVQHSKAPSWTGWAHTGTFRHLLVVSLAFAFRVLLEVSLELKGLQLNETVGMFDVSLARNNGSLLCATCVYDVLSGGLHSFHSLQGK
jgi:hypothetical protein